MSNKKVRLPTCPHCNSQVSKDEISKKYKARTYHLDCYNNLVQKKYNEAKPQLTQEQALYEYICKLFKIKELTPFLDNQLKKIMNESKNKMTYSGIHYSLIYFFEIKENKINENSGIGIVPYIYEEAKNYYYEKQKIIKIAEGFQTNSITEKVFVAPKQRQNKFLIDLEKL